MSNELLRTFEDHGHALYRIAWRILGQADDVDDVLQDVLVEAMRVGQREPVTSWIGLLKRLIVCRSVDLLRKRNTGTVFSDAEFSEFNHPSSNISPEEVAIARELDAQFREMLSQLSGRQAEVFSLRYFDDCSNQEIAQTLGISSAAVATALMKSRRKLAALLLTDPTEGTVQ